MGRTAVLVDAGYFFKAGGQVLVGAGQAPPQRELTVDLEAFLRLTRQTVSTVTNKPLLRIYWYDAALSTGLTAQHRLIADAPFTKLRLGHLNSANQQKGVDPLLITDMIMLARNRACEDLILLAGDGDLVVGVQQAQEHGVQVHLLGIGASRGNQSPQLRWEVDECHEWGSAEIQQVLQHTPRPAVTPPAAPPPSASGATGSSSATPAPAAAGGGAALTTAAAPTTASATAPSSPATPGAAAPSAPALAGSVTEAGMRQVAADVERQLDGVDRAAILNAPRKGIIPGHVDRRLIGSGKAMLQTVLNEAEKRQLRQYLYDACAAAQAGPVVAPSATPAVPGSGTASSNGAASS
jgi:uncharacterized LabA/DUF88 family protein